ncbi:hypothetical protein [Planktothrix tepida]|uniref:Uncharacterized protein n=1 Tax=Planktothrix tepida PCC 9214 TaxID=671072 RepID=A0A1J1LJ22_9CYAN|nr:hypothetical protein [Planktothrix tepida]CUR32499.1 hypothetical protein PL9214490046 [Planktothrix tepida PCC 9214]
MSIRQNIAIATNSNSKKVIVTINIDIIFDHRIFVSRILSENVGNLMSDIVGKCRKNFYTHQEYGYSRGFKNR